MARASPAPPRMSCPAMWLTEKAAISVQKMKNMYNTMHEKKECLSRRLLLLLLRPPWSPRGGGGSRGRCGGRGGRRCQTGPGRENTIMSIFCGVLQRYPPTILRMTLSMSSSHGSPIGSANPLMSPETSSVPRRNLPSSLTRRPERLSRMLRWFSRSNGLEGSKRN